MSEKRFIVPKEKDEEFYWNIIDTENGKVVLQHISLLATTEMCFLLNGLDYECTFLLEQREDLKDTCKQLKQQYLNLGNAIVKTCNDLNNTEEVYLGDFDICKMITEYEKELSGVSIYDSEKEEYISASENGLKEIAKRMNEQQDKITELEKNFDDLVQWASEIAKRNVVLDEQIGELQRENEQLRKELGDCEKFRYTVFKKMGDILDE